MAIFDKYGRIINPPYRQSSTFNSGDEYGRITNPLYRSTINRQQHSPRRSINDIIINIGDWIDDKREMWAYYISMCYYWLAWLVLIIGVISKWHDSGFLSAALTAIIGGIIVFYVGMIVVVIQNFVLQFFFFVLRYIFYNIYTLLIFIVLIAGIGLYLGFSNSANRHETTTFSNTTPPQPAIDYYYCNGNNVKVHGDPSQKRGNEIGKLQLNDKVAVLYVSNNFDKIRFNDKIGWVLATYLQNKPVQAVKPVPPATGRTVPSAQQSNNETVYRQNLAAAEKSFKSSKYDEAFSYYQKAGEAGKTAGYKAFADKAKELIDIFEGECDNVVKKLLRHAQQLNNTQEIRNLINNCK